MHLLATSTAFIVRSSLLADFITRSGYIYLKKESDNCARGSEVPRMSVDTKRQKKKTPTAGGYQD